jgi:hypothetical protein
MDIDEKVTYLRNVANEGRGSTMTAALHDACDEILALHGHANALRDRLVHEYTNGPLVDQSIGAALPQEVYDYDADFPRKP